MGQCIHSCKSFMYHSPHVLSVPHEKSQGQVVPDLSQISLLTKAKVMRSMTLELVRKVIGSAPGGLPEVTVTEVAATECLDIFERNAIIIRKGTGRYSRWGRGVERSRE